MLGGSGSYLSEAYEGVLVQLTQGATFSEDDGYAKHVTVDDGSGDMEGATSCMAFDVDSLRAYYGESSLEDNVLTYLRGIMDFNSAMAAFIITAISHVVGDAREVTDNSQAKWASRRHQSGVLEAGPREAATHQKNCQVTS